MRILHFCAGLQGSNGMANTARQFVAEELAAGHESRLTNRVEEIAGQFDVVCIHGAWLPVVHKAAKRAQAVGARLWVRPAGSYDPVRRRFHAWKKLLMAPWEHAMLDRAEVVLATCRQEAEWIRDYHPAVKVELTDLRRFFRIPERVAMPRRETPDSFSDHPLRVLYLGRQHPLKGVEYLRQAVGEINRQADSLASGEGRRVELREVSSVYGEELERRWQWCEVLCLPTLSENFGRVVAEALAHGKPVITTDGAPAWENLRAEQGIYLRGYRDGDAATRVRLLTAALKRMLGLTTSNG